MSRSLSSLTPDEVASLKSNKEVGRFAFVRTVGALILREMAVTYGRSPGGYIWALLEPILGIGLLVLIFSISFRAPPIGNSFALYYATGMLSLGMVTSTIGKVSQSINYSRQLLNYPRVTFMDAILARFILNLLTQSVVTSILLTAICWTTDTRSAFHLGRYLGALAMGAGLGLGVGMLLCTLISQHPIYQTIWGVLTRPLFLISGVLIPHESIPEPYQTWLDWNPIVHVVAQTRLAFYYSYQAEYLDITYVCIVALICGASGMFFLRRYYRNMMEK